MEVVGYGVCLLDYIDDNHNYLNVLGFSQEVAISRIIMISSFIYNNAYTVKPGILVRKKTVFDFSRLGTPKRSNFHSLGGYGKKSRIDW